MSSVKMPYYPQMTVTQRKTRFGVSEIYPRDLYDTPIAGRYIVRVDLLYALLEQWGDKWLCARETTYELVSGNRDDTACAKLLASYYRKYSAITEHVNSLYAIMGNTEKPLVTIVLHDALEQIRQYEDFVMRYLGDRGGKFLVSTHDYVYYAFRSKPEEFSDLKGVTVIC